jgi:hypothetical protein
MSDESSLAAMLQIAPTSSIADHLYESGSCNPTQLLQTYHIGPREKHKTHDTLSARLILAI